MENDLMMVQGVAGSGKTSIALHRAAYLMYQDLQVKLSANNIIIISPNSLFEQYISDVLPELGESNVVSMVFEEINCFYEQQASVICVYANHGVFQFVRVSVCCYLHRSCFVPLYRESKKVQPVFLASQNLYCLFMSMGTGYHLYGTAGRQKFIRILLSAPNNGGIFIAYSPGKCSNLWLYLAFPGFYFH